MEKHLTPNNARLIEQAAAALAAKFGLEQDDIRLRILKLVAPHPPRQQCKDAIEKVRAECEAALSNAPPEE